MRSFFQNGGIWLKKTIGSSLVHAFLVGTAAGAMLLAWCFQWTARLGTSLAVTSALGLAILVGIELGFRPFRSARPSRTICWTIVLALALLAGWTVGFPS